VRPNIVELNVLIVPGVNNKDLSILLATIRIVGETGIPVYVDKSCIEIVYVLYVGTTLIFNIVAMLLKIMPEDRDYPLTSGIGYIITNSLRNQSSSGTS
jgi:hypothetical protein